MQGAGFYKGAWRRAKNDGVVARAFDAGWLAGMAACYTGFAWDDVTGATAPSPNPSPLQGEGDQNQSQSQSQRPPLACWPSGFPPRHGEGLGERVCANNLTTSGMTLHGGGKNTSGRPSLWPSTG